MAFSENCRYQSPPTEGKENNILGNISNTKLKFETLGSVGKERN